MYIQPLTEGNYFHIFNRGINGENLFKEDRNYYYFLEQYKNYCSAVFDTLAYSLLKNHFHLFVYVKENVTVSRYDGKGVIQLNASKQLSHFFNSYAQSINKSWQRTGPLFESPFERKLVDDSSYYTDMIFYCHYNPQLHGFVNDFKQWEFTSYHDIKKRESRICSSQKVLDWFGNKLFFEKAHEGRHEVRSDNKFLIE